MEICPESSQKILKPESFLNFGPRSSPVREPPFPWQTTSTADPNWSLPTSLKLNKKIKMGRRPQIGNYKPTTGRSSTTQLSLGVEPGGICTILWIDFPQLLLVPGRRRHTVRPESSPRYADSPVSAVYQPENVWPRPILCYRSTNGFSWSPEKTANSKSQVVQVP